MIAGIRQANSTAGQQVLLTHLLACDKSFTPPLSQRLDIAGYAEKLQRLATCFEAWSGEELVGLVAAYCNTPDRDLAFVTNVSVLPAWHGQRIATGLLSRCIGHVRDLGFARLELEVEEGNQPAIALYKSHGFRPVGQTADMTRMGLAL